MVTQQIYTIGHSNHTLEAFLRLMEQHEIELLIDVRSRPYSRYSPHFNLKRIEKALDELGIRYLFLGRELGGLPENDEYYDEDNHVLYYRIANSAAFLDGIARVETSIGEARTAILCAEENPVTCHRRVLVGRVLADRGIGLRHIRADGRVQTEEEVAESERTSSHGAYQVRLDDAEHDLTWKSKKPVPRKSTARALSKPKLAKRR
jgi:uncharacterized protein (DUF488 family)